MDYTLKSVITDTGKRLAARLLSSASPLSITSARVGDGPLLNGILPSQMAELSHAVMEAAISDLQLLPNGDTIVRLQILPTTVAIAFEVTEAAVYALDPDAGEILYAYISMQEDPIRLAPAEEGVGKILILEVELVTSNMAQVSVALTPGVLVSLEQMNQSLQLHNEAVAAHENRFAAVAGKDHVHPQIDALEARMARLEDALFNNITGNPFQAAFDNLAGIALEQGVWNAARQRLEC